MRDRTNILVLAALLFMLPGCDIVTGPKTLGDFSWAEIEGGPVEDSSNFVAVGSDVLLLGEIGTPTACYNLTPHLAESRTRLTLRIAARSTQTPNCEQRAGSYRYQVMLHRLDRGTYELVIVHDVEDGERTEFRHSLTI
ncbi:MAG TPA: hypothetical protein VMN60_06410 [Longimicrobiales bacterium]|nr:hypothetical protein [Longimicrobiales bacterium]